jgi:hypothetical protein
MNIIPYYCYCYDVLDMDMRTTAVRMGHARDGVLMEREGGKQNSPPRQAGVRLKYGDMANNVN